MAEPRKADYAYSAHNDILVVRELLPKIEVFAEAIAFHAQQSIEKQIKHIFVLNMEEPPRTHNVDDLLCLTIDRGWLSVAQDIIDTASDISVFAVLARYNCSLDIACGEARRAIREHDAIAQTILDNGYSAELIH